MEISPDNIIYAQWGPVILNATIVNGLIVSAVLVFASWLITRRLNYGLKMSRWQNLLEVIVSTIRNQVREVSQDAPDRYLPFIGSLFLYILLSNILTIVPQFLPPTGSLSATSALAICVFFAVPYFGIQKKGVGGYFKYYIQPSPVMLPFNIIGDFSRTLALAVRLFGNMMSGTLILGILLSVTPLFVPVVMRAFGLLIGVIQAYIFAILAMVYIASASRIQEDREAEQNNNNSKTE